MLNKIIEKGMVRETCACVCVCVCVCVHVCVCVCVHVHACVHACERMHVCVHACVLSSHVDHLFCGCVAVTNVCDPSCSSSVSRTGLPPSQGAPWTTVSSRSHSKQSTRSLRTPSVDWSSPTWRYVCICMVCVPEELVLVRRVGLRTYILSVYVRM